MPRSGSCAILGMFELDVSENDLVTDMVCRKRDQVDYIYMIIVVGRDHNTSSDCCCSMVLSQKYWFLTYV